MKTSGVAAAVLVAALAFTTAPLASAATDSVVVTNADNGRIINLPVGKDMTVNLTPVLQNGAKKSWSKVVSSNVHTLVLSRGAQTPNGGSKATFRAVEVGNVELRATATCVSCNHAQTWTVKVKID